mgnify:CR=1 FL=1
MSEPIRFYFDFSSPYGYLASRRIEAVAARHGRTVDWNPILLGIMFRVTGQSPLLQQPLRGPYFVRDMQRTAREWDVRLVMPEHFPFHSVAASRAFYWLKDSAPDRAVAFAHAIYGAYWGEGRDVDKPEQVAEVASAIGLDGDALREALGQAAVKDRLKTEMDDAMEKGVFGSPTMLVDGEMFFGCDKFDQMERWLQKGGW